MLPKGPPAPLETEEPPVEVTEADMQSMDNPSSKVWRRVAPEDHERVLAELRAEEAKFE